MGFTPRKAEPSLLGIKLQKKKQKYEKYFRNPFNKNSKTRDTYYFKTLITCQRKALCRHRIQSLAVRRKKLLEYTSL